MKNPWTDVKDQYVLPSDRPNIERFNRRCREAHDDQHRLNLTLIAEPFMGNREAHVVILLLNPGFGDEDPDVHGNNKDYAAALHANLGDDPGGHVVAGLLPQFHGTPAYKSWAGDRLKDLVYATGDNPGRLARQILVVEFHGYHARSYKRIQPLPPKQYLPSQRYGFHLVERAINRDALIVIPTKRGATEWERAIAPLTSYRKQVRKLKSIRSQRLSTATLGADGFRRVVQALGA